MLSSASPEEFQGRVGEEKFTPSASTFLTEHNFLQFDANLRIV